MVILFIFNNCGKFESIAASATLLIDFIYSLDNFRSIKVRATLNDDSFLYFEKLESSARLKIYIYI